MKRCFPSALAGLFSFLWAALPAVAQTPAPPVPALTRAQKEAAAAIQAPQTVTPPPLPGQLQGGAAATATMPAAPQAPAPASIPPPAEVPANSASKLQVLEAVTQKAPNAEVPRVSTPSDKLPVTTSTSTSRQFIVHGKVFETRSAMSSRCEEISDELRKVLNDREPWVLPVVVVLNTGDEAMKSKGPPISTTISEMNFGGFHLQVTVNERPGLGTADLRKEVVRALLAERILRNHEKIVTPEGRLLLPDWIMTGVMKAMDYRSNANPSAMFSTLFKSGKIYGIEEIIEASPVEMDNLSRTIYETSCCALVLALVDQPSGPQHLNKFLNSLASDPRSERDLLSAAFPNFAASASSLNKWWSLQLASLAKPRLGEPMTPAESLKAIEEAITIHYEAPPAQVPKNVKMHPFILPPPLPVAGSDEARPMAAATDETSRSKARAAAATTAASKNSAPDSATADADTEEDKPKRSLLRRMLFLGDPEKKEPEPKDGDKPAETTSEKGTEEDKKPGFVGRMFGFGGAEKKVSEKEGESKTSEKSSGAAAVAEKPKSKPKAAAKSEPEPEAAEEKKPSNLNPLNWFRGEKKPAEPKKEDKPAKEKQTFVEPPEAIDVARMISPALADAWQLLAPAAPRLTAEPLFGFRKAKPKAEEAKVEPKAEPPAADDRPAVKKSTKPKRTNPNSKPAAKPATAPAGQAQTTNPNARPVPAGMVPPTTGTPAEAAAATPGTELVPVTLPLEEYQQILKHPDRAKILDYNIASLRALDLRVNVLLRPVVRNYLAAVLDIEAGKTKDMDKRLAALHAFALVAYQKSIAVRDYMDWFEASESGRLSGKFDDFLNLPEIIKKELPARTDPISKYLDAIDKEFSK